MSKIEVLRVPDKRLPDVAQEIFEDGDLVILHPSGFWKFVYPDEKPALLAALLEDAGAERVTFWKGSDCPEPHVLYPPWPLANGESREFYVLPILKGADK